MRFDMRRLYYSKCVIFVADFNCPSDEFNVGIHSVTSP